ncbi:RecX family transcriptional regulator [Sphingomonas sp. RHCKR7]|uniref:regulatory protein RecX n=1 Tax=Sphingomonas folli TaxID=2862497 RepID=UPI001CA4A8A7|nr:RecX family transcriptional regulator [Sphingomonas folli]MBW6527680.1 RecX family transcriptional regulator [Sphingomonas folli]
MAVSLSPSPRSSPRRRPPPLDGAALERLALRYVERFATTRGKLSAYLARKIRERGWTGEPADPEGVAERMAALGYVDDRGFAEQKGAALGRRGYGARRVAETLRAAGLDAEDAAPVLAQARAAALESALRLARRRRIGPFADAPADPAQRARQLGQLLRAGHDASLARRIVEAEPGAILDEE